ncbi:MAG TPA: hypothetical protein VLJ59_09770 [Mycobacteriales bacterium]|nr:hypothetical protein [Mycobacteriales bacterium]
MKWMLHRLALASLAVPTLLGVAAGSASAAPLATAPTVLAATAPDAHLAAATVTFTTNDENKEAYAELRHAKIINCVLAGR